MKNIIICVTIRMIFDMCEKVVILYFVIIFGEILKVMTYNTVTGDLIVIGTDA